jgi:hypothetical protein
VERALRELAVLVGTRDNTRVDYGAFRVTTLNLNGYQFTISDPYAPGHPLTPEEAQALNALRAENIRNNFAKRHVAGAIEAASGALLSLPQLRALQVQLDEYASTYSFGARKPNPRLGLIEAQALEIARGTAEQGASEEDILALASTEPVLAEARARVAERKRVTNGALEELL